MFVDKAVVAVEAGSGGNGVVSFRHEKYVDRGGPDGGDGGKGGDIVLTAASNQHTLARFRHQKLLKADDGGSGGKRKRHGKNGDSLVVPVPVGTVVRDEQTDTIIGDLTVEGTQLVVAKGGLGGFGNAHFTSSTRQAPRIAEKGEPGQKFELELELKMIADVGLVGLPNAGKSTFLSVVSNARPEIADYPFTTLQPNLGVVDIGKQTMLLADIPGLIAGASQGKGLGDDFLRHVERTAVLLHLIDVHNDNLALAYQTIQNELKSYQVDLSSKPQIVALTKTEGLDTEILDDRLAQLHTVVPESVAVYCISSQAHQGIDPLLRNLQQLVQQQRALQSQQQSATEQTDGVPVITLPSTAEDSWRVEKKQSGFVVHGPKIERFARRTDFAQSAATDRLRDIMRKMGIVHELARQGATAGDKIEINGLGTIEY